MTAPAHLLPETAALLSLSPRQRCLSMRQQKFVPYPAGMAALRWLRYHYDFEAGRDRPQSLHLMGAPGIGKSRVLTHYAALHAVSEADRDSDGHLQRPVVLLEMPSSGDFRAFCNELMATCIPGFRAQTAATYLQRVGPALRQCGVKQLLIDEAGNLLNGGKHAQQHCLSLLKSVTNQGITVCIATTENMRAVLAADDQLLSRFTRVVLPEWTESQDLRQFLLGIEAQLPLPEPSNLARMEIVRWLMARGLTVTSPLLKLLREAATLAIVAGEPCITLARLEQAAAGELPPDLGLA